MGIALDGTTGLQDTVSAVTSDSENITISGSDRLIVIGAKSFGTATITATVDGVAVDAGNIYTRLLNFSAHRITLMWLAAPNTGTVSVALTASTSNRLVWAAASYTGVDQTTPMDATPVQGNSDTSATSRTETITTATLDAWLVAAFGTHTGNPLAGTGTTSRGAGTQFLLADSGAAVGAAGSHSLQATFSSARWADILFALRPASGTAYTLTVDAGAVTVTGTAVTFARTYVLAVASGTVTLTGTAVGALAGRVVAVDSGAVAVSGTAVGLYRGYPLAVASGAVTVTGSAVGFLRGYVVAVASGNVALTGTAVGLLRSHILPIASGSVTITGTDITLTHGTSGAYTLAVASGGVTITGGSIGLLVGRSLAVSSGSVTITGSSVALTASRLLGIAGGSVTVSGSAVGLLVNRLLTVGSGSVTLTGTAIGFLRTHVVSVGTGAVTLTGADVTLTYTAIGTAQYVAVLTGQPRYAGTLAGQPRYAATPDGGPRYEGTLQ